MRYVRTPKWGEGWNTVECLGSYKGWIVEIGYNPQAAKPYCVQMGGAGHYFSTVGECKAYAQGRGWIGSSWNE